MQNHYHELKTWPEHFLHVRLGMKTFEARRADRQFKFGDYLRLKEWCPDRGEYTGEQCEVVITHLLGGGEFGIEPGHCVMSIRQEKIPDGVSEAETEQPT